jgi:hypothetical protein
MKGIFEDSVAVLPRIHSFGIETEVCQTYSELMYSNYMSVKSYIFRLTVKTMCWVQSANVVQTEVGLQEW